MTLVREDILRAYLNFFKVKGGGGPRVAPDILPVVILDDNSKGPYAPYRAFFAGTSLGALVANYSYVGITNGDSLSARSVAVIDKVIARTSVADDITISIATSADLALGGNQGVLDAAPEKEQAPTLAPRLGNVVIGSANSVTSFGGAGVPNNQVTPVQVDGPWTLGPGEVLLVRPNNLNEGIFLYARGRYYSTL